MTWEKIVLRGLGTTNVVMGAMGVYLQTDGLIRFSRQHSFADSHDVKAFWIMTSICLAIVAVTLISGILLWKMGRWAARLCIACFAFELAYWLGSSVVRVSLITSHGDRAHTLAASLARVTGIANVGISPQILSFYPVWALLLLCWALARLQKQPTRA